MSIQGDAIKCSIFEIQFQHESLEQIKVIGDLIKQEDFHFLSFGTSILAVRGRQNEDKQKLFSIRYCLNICIFKIDKVNRFHNAIINLLGNIDKAVIDVIVRGFYLYDVKLGQLYFSYEDDYETHRRVKAFSQLNQIKGGQYFEHNEEKQLAFIHDLLIQIHQAKQNVKIITFELSDVRILGAIESFLIKNENAQCHVIMNYNEKENNYDIKCMKNYNEKTKFFKITYLMRTYRDRFVCGYLIGDTVHEKNTTIDSSNFIGSSNISYQGLSLSVERNINTQVFQQQYQQESIQRFEKLRKLTQYQIFNDIEYFTSEDYSNFRNLFQYQTKILKEIKPINDQ
ncbi:PLD-like domain protein (macronuclear) [Tetrahymena thermophila SB210]|uniref:PLD-like domain protein n=1 Tax=Tetrahymena thermophila (strain SB210) TaxID=312017 RepID=I7MN13_TETTS|nr:PLD-like domain protein [Tetrahymena thermophila SB210]EAS07710.3 PLD-like domain protein [Tetrahymena thermophila SB210]|eukprot:XP_001027952.3 PLD-like domain protein [Tetrahymena thermophila SB210]